jgi:hypothetical protein
VRGRWMHEQGVGDTVARREAPRASRAPCALYPTEENLCQCFPDAASASMTEDAGAVLHT